jgi:hypothetical protein
VEAQRAAIDWAIAQGASPSSSPAPIASSAMGDWMAMKRAID